MNDCYTSSHELGLVHAVCCDAVFYAETKSEVTLSAHQIFSEFFTVQLLTELCWQLVLNYFPLREDELGCWLTDPENFSMCLNISKHFMMLFVDLCTF